MANKRKIEDCPVPDDRKGRDETCGGCTFAVECKARGIVEARPGKHGCPCCGAADADGQLVETDVRNVLRCTLCDAIFTRCGKCIPEDTGYGIVVPEFSDRPPKKTVYYNLLVWSAGRGTHRRHGWYDPETRKIVQTG